MTPPVPSPVYAIRLRSLQTLETYSPLLWFQNLSWSRSLHEAGTFVVQAAYEDIPSDALLHPTRYEVQETLIEIRRDGALEFLGVFDSISPDESTGMLTIRGVDAMSYLLASRDIVPAVDNDYSTQITNAESAILAIVDNAMITTTDPDRDINGFLDGVTFALPSDNSRGATVTLRARYINLLGAVRALAREGGLIVGLSLQAADSGYVLTIDEPANNDVTFAVRAGTALNVYPTWTRARRYNAIYGLGQGRLARRTVSERVDAIDVATHLRREYSSDERNYPTTARLDLAANPSDSETVTVGNKVYTFQTTLTNVDGNVLIGGDRDESLANLAAAINLTPGAGTIYAAATTTNDYARVNTIEGGALEVAATGRQTTVTTTETLADGEWSTSEIDLAGLQAALDARLERSDIQSRSYRVEPDPGGAPYRTAWDLGDDVHVRSDLFGVVHEQRIVRVSVRLDPNRYETISIDLGDPPETLPQLLAGQVNATNNVLRE